MIGKTISHYRITAKLGEGGMGVVYKAEDLKLHRAVALKFLPPGSFANREAKTRFMREARIAASLDHASVCPLFEIDETEEHAFIAMALVQGHSLQEMIAEGPVKLDVALDIAIQVAEGLDHAHQKNIVHRDIKPSNVMVTSGDQAKILDFGLARSADETQLTREGTTLGTVAYMSPEQARAAAVDHRSDIWSLGIVLYEMISGRRPFAGDHQQAIIYSILNERQEPLTGLRSGVPLELERLIDRCLEKEPAARYQTAADLASDLRRIQGRLVSGPQPTVTALRGSEPRGVRPRRRWPGHVGAVVVATLALVLALAIYPRLAGRHDLQPDSGRKRLVVLPFENLGAPEDEYFADGITEEITARLAGIRELGVIARTSAMRYKDTDKTIAQIGDDLKVDYVLEGTIRWQRASNDKSRVRVTPQLIRVSDATHVWADVLDADMNDIFKVQSGIAEQIAQVLDIALLAGEREALEIIPTENMDAYRAYLEGRFWWNKRSQEGFDKALVLFDEAIRIDPEYALAYAGKAECYCMQAMQLAQPAKVAEIARAAAEKALELDDSIPEVYSALGWIAWTYDYDYEAAERSFKRAINLDPGYATAYNWYAVMLACIGRDDEAVHYMTRALQLDPGSMIINRDLGCVLSWLGRFDDAERQLEKTIDMDPSFTPAHAHLGRIYTAKGMYDEAIAEFEIIRAIDSEYFCLDMMLGYTYAKMGRREESQQILDEFLARTHAQKVKAFEIAFVQTGLGNIDEAFEWFDKTVENREFAIVLLDVHIWLDDLRRDPRFEALRKKIGLSR